MKKTYKELITLVSNLENVVGNQETKVQQKLLKIFEKVKPFYQEYQSQVQELRLDNAATNANGILLLDEKKDYQFNKEGVKKLSKDIDKLKEKSFDFTPIQVFNPNGLELFIFLKDWIEGIEFLIESEEEL